MFLNLTEKSAIKPEITIVVTKINGLCQSSGVVIKNAKNSPINTSKKLYIGDISDKKLLKKIYNEYSPDGIIHLAASISVAESEKKKSFYYKNNFLK